MDQLAVNIGPHMPPKSSTEMEKEALNEKSRRASRPLLLLSNLSTLPYVIKSAVWPSSSRKTSETFSDDHTFLFDLKHLASSGFRFDHDALFGRLRRIPGLVLWTAVAVAFILPHIAPTLLAYLTLMCLLQNVTVMLFATLNTFRGFHRIVQSMSNPPPHPSRVALGGHDASSLSSSSNSGTSTNSGNSAIGAAGALVAGGAKPSPHGVQPADILHLIVICRCTEPVDVLEETLTNLASHNNRDTYVILLALEAKDDKATAVGELLARKWGRSFARVLYAVHHMADGEVPGKSSNTAWAVQTATASLERDPGMGPRACDRMVVTVCDIDARINQHYFNSLSIKFACALRENRPVFFAPPSLFDEGVADAAAEAKSGALTPRGGMSPMLGGGGGGNALASPGGAPSPLGDGSAILRSNSGRVIMKAVSGGAIPAPVRIADSMWSMFLLQNLASANWVKMPCSTYSVGLRLIASVGWWDVGVESVPEDYHTALKLYFGTSGRCRCEPIYHPVIYQHIDGGSWLGGVNQRFQQGIRHMWGATDVAYVLWLAVKLTHVPLAERLALVVTVLDVHLSASVIALLGSFAFPILMLLRPDWAASDDGRIALLLQKMLTAALLGLTFVTGACYEWHATDCLRAALALGPPSSSLTASASAMSLTGLLPVTPRGDRSSSVAAGGSGGGSGSNSGSGGSGERAKSSIVVGAGGLSSGGAASVVDVGAALGAGAAEAPVSWALHYFARLAAWFWAPIIAVLYLLAPASYAQTKLLWTDRLKLHVSPKSSPVPPSTPGGPNCATPGGSLNPPVAVSLATGDVTACISGGSGVGMSLSDLEAGSGGDSMMMNSSNGGGGPGSRRGSFAVVPPISGMDRLTSSSSHDANSSGGVGGSSTSPGSSGPRGRLGSGIGVGLGLLKAHLTVAGANAAAAQAAYGHHSGGSGGGGVAHHGHGSTVSGGGAGNVMVL